MKEKFKSKSNFQLVFGQFSISSWVEKGHKLSRAEPKIFQFELWLEPARLGLITRKGFHYFAKKKLCVLKHKYWTMVLLSKKKIDSLTPSDLDIQTRKIRFFEQIGKKITALCFAYARAGSILNGRERDCWCCIGKIWKVFAEEAS